MALVFDIGRGVEPLDIIEEKYICHIEVSDKSKFFSDSFNLSQNANFVIKKGELLFEYIKPIEAKFGKDLKGRVITPKNIKINSTNNIYIDNTIKKEDQIDCIKYFAAKNGFLRKKDGKYFIDDNIYLETLDAKKVQDVSLGNDDEKLSIFIQNSDYLQDSIQSGVDVDVVNAYIKGNIDRANIKAEKIYIQGKTHSKSTISAEIAYINTHKGKLQAKIAFVDNLENGEINAEIVFVKYALGGTIKANFIYIENCVNYCCVYPKSYLVIEKITGHTNTFEVNSQRFIDDEESIVEYYENLSKDIKKKLDYFSYQIRKIKNYVYERQNKIYTHDKIDENLDFVKQYNEKLDEYKKVLGCYQNTLKLAYAVNIFLNRIYETAFYAKIAVEYNYGEDNLINFIHKPNKIDIRYILQKNDKNKVFFMQNKLDIALEKEEKFNREEISWINISKKDYF
ncbi:DUF342 domain-containing protein [Campylobacter lari]|nr:DUF342 domain-containing protein [Campylobacter lari]EAH8419690.1 DUF342 domain-containing protein [Campylobacter lari]EAK5788973.1 DUF342 domain-containing protein [Campylobacter lari]EAK5965446.1 DUF342 domain-containing protein [Campylobacter lari]EAW7430507.1 DUF342 domain-containing protein [Campylobacter lari]